MAQMDRAALMMLKAAPDSAPPGLLGRFCRAAMHRYCVDTYQIACWFGVPAHRIWNALAQSDDRHDGFPEASQ